MEPMLPPGNELSTQPVSADGVERCYLDVDGNPAFAASIQWWKGEDATLAWIAKGEIGVDPFDKMTPDNRYIYSSTGAVGRVACPEEKRTGEKVFVSLRTDSGATKSREGGTPTESQMEKLIIAFSESVPASGKCKEG
ncbi:hypothetical protein [Streptomyces sp. NPDC000410]|uniref:hypothetical protein n=1 Tax=Streptomyces sp. NPDC000410 TaxID=3154254 RepID=UPI003330E331